MKIRLAAPLCPVLLAALVVPVQAAAAGVQHVYDGLNVNQYLMIMLVGLILVAVFIGIFYLIGERHSRRTKVNMVTKNIALILAIVYLIVGTFLLVIDFIIIIEPFAETDAFTDIVRTFQYYFPELIFGIIVVGATGLLLYLVGFYIILFLRQSTKIKKDDDKYHIQSSSEMDIDVSKGNVEYTKLSFRVTEWGIEEPLSDGKIRLETKDGTLMMIKYTNTEGEVDFGKVRGREDDYYAYVEGDKERQQYRLVTFT